MNLLSIDMTIKTIQTNPSICFCKHVFYSDLKVMFCTRILIQVTKIHITVCKFYNKVKSLYLSIEKEKMWCGQFQLLISVNFTNIVSEYFSWIWLSFTCSKNKKFVQTRNSFIFLLLEYMRMDRPESCLKYHWYISLVKILKILARMTILSVFILISRKVDSDLTLLCVCKILHFQDISSTVYYFWVKP